MAYGEGRKNYQALLRLLSHNGAKDHIGALVILASAPMHRRTLRTILRDILGDVLPPNRRRELLGLASFINQNESKFPPSRKPEFSKELTSPVLAEREIRLLADIVLSLAESEYPKIKELAIDMREDFLAALDQVSELKRYGDVKAMFCETSYLPPPPLPPPPPPRPVETKSFLQKHPLLSVGIAAAGVLGVIFLVQEHNSNLDKAKINVGLERVNEGMQTECAGNPSEKVPYNITPQTSVPPTYNAPASRTQVAEWPKPKDWFYNECNVIERNVQFCTGGGYRYDNDLARKISSCISTLRSKLYRDDIGGSVRAYNELKQAYLSFANGCQWQPNVRHPKYNHVFSGYTKNQWVAENGWEFVNPGTSDLTVRRKLVQVRCNSCQGSGCVVQRSQCYSCNGRGRIPNPAAQVGQAVNVVGGLINAFGGNHRGRPMPRVPQGPSEIRCSSCNGTGGQQTRVRCGRCNGAGAIYQ